MNSNNKEQFKIRSNKQLYRQDLNKNKPHPPTSALSKEENFGDQPSPPAANGQVAQP